MMSIEIASVFKTHISKLSVEVKIISVSLYSVKLFFLHCLELYLNEGIFSNIDL